MLGVGAAIAAGVAAERAFVRRDLRRHDPYRDEPYGDVRGRAVGPVVSSDGTLLHVEEAGSGPTLVLSHGFSLNLTLWHHQIKDLSRDHRLVLYDHRGHGRSGRPTSDDWSLEALACDLDAVIRECGGPDPIVLVGHSMGGMALIKYCEMFPIGTQVAGLVLVDTTSADVMEGMLPGAARRVEAAFQALQAVAMRALAGRADTVDRIRSGGSSLAYLGTRLMGFGPRPSPAQVRFLERMLASVPSDVWVSLVPAIVGIDLRHALPAIDVPVMVIAGSHDRLTPIEAARRIAEAIPDAEMVVIADTGHTPMLEHHEVFDEHLRRFVARARAGAAAR